MRTYEVTRRFVLHAGYSCNERCQFCYYLEDLQQGRVRDWSTAENRRRISLAARWGKRAIDISGGEPTIRPDLPELIRHCKAQGFERVTIITNGLRCADRGYCEALAAAGLDEGLFSVHSHDPAIHDDLTRVKSSHGRVLQALANFTDLGLDRRVNTVVNAENYRFLDHFFAVVRPFCLSEVNLIVFNPSETAANLDRDARVRFTDYAAIGLAISEAIDRNQSTVPTINVRFLPFCFLPVHPGCVRTQWQKFHEDAEWDPFLNVALQKGLFRAVAATFAGLLLPQDSPRFLPADLPTGVSKALSNLRMRMYYRKAAACRRCAVSPICPGLQRDFVEKYGFPELKPLPGPRITDPLHFCHDQPERFSSLRR